jgi:hypothetical protein
MRIQYVSTYISMSKDGLVEKLLCPVDQSILFCNQSLQDEVYLYCLECDYKKELGLSSYEKIVNEVNKNV